MPERAGRRRPAAHNGYLAGASPRRRYGDHCHDSCQTTGHPDFTSGTTAPPLALSHAIIAVGAYNTVSTTVSAYFNVAKDGGNLAEVNRETPNTAGWQDAGLAQQEALSAVSTTWKWRARAETGSTTVNVAGLAIAVLQLEATPAAVRRRYMAIAA